MPIKILAINNYRGYHTTRPEAKVFTALANMEEFDIHIMTYLDAEHIEDFEKSGIKIHKMGPQKKFDQIEINRIREILIEEQIDILHLFSSSAIINGIRAAKGLKVKVVLYRGYSGNIHWYDPTAYFKYLNPRVDKIVCNSIGVEEHIQNQLFFDKSKTITINKGHDVEWYKDYKPYNIKKELNIPKDAFIIVNVANNRRMKGIPYLLKAFNLIPENLPIYLLIIGRDMDTKENLKIINKRKDKNKIRLLGFRNNSLNIVAAANTFILPSIKGESITKSVIEAMSLGIAPIISDIRGNYELIENNVSGLIFPSKNITKIRDAILFFFNNQDKCIEMGKNAKNRIITHLNTENTINKTKEFYLSLIK